MIVVVDTNVCLSGLISPYGFPGQIYNAWRLRFLLIATCEKQLEEMRSTSRRAKFAKLFQPADAGLMINEMLKGKVVLDIPRRYHAADPTDSFLLDLAVEASAQFLITGDKRSGLLQLGKVESTRILTAAQFCNEILKPMNVPPW